MYVEICGSQNLLSWARECEWKEAAGGVGRSARAVARTPATERTGESARVMGDATPAPLPSEPTARPPIPAELDTASGTVLVRNQADCRALHAWPGGAFGEILAYDAVDGSVVTGPPPGAKGHQRRPLGSTVIMLRLRAWEAIFLAFETQPPRLRIVEATSDDNLGTTATTTFAAMEAEAAAAVAAAPALDLATCWRSFCSAEPDLPQLYAAYVALRAAGWYIRDGIKFGFDFALYDPKGPSTRHAPLGALVLTRAGEGERNWLWLQRHARVCHSVGKGLLLCSVEPSSTAGDAAERVPPLMDVQTLRIDGWDPGKAHATLSQ